MFGEFHNLYPYGSRQVFVSRLYLEPNNDTTVNKLIDLLVESHIDIGHRGTRQLQCAYMCIYHMHCVCVLRQARSHEYQMYACTGEVVLTIMMSGQLLKLTGCYFACFKSCVPFLIVYKQVSAHKVFCNMGFLVSPQPVLNFLLCESGHIFIS